MQVGNLLREEKELADRRYLTDGSDKQAGDACRTFSRPTVPIDRDGPRYGSSRAILAESLTQASKDNLLKENPHAKSDKGPITTGLFDLFKIGPGPSSSHTMGPMKAAFNFLVDCRDWYSEQSQKSDFSGRKFKITCTLHGSLSATGKGHHTDVAIIGGLLGWLPAVADCDEMLKFMSEPGQVYLVPITIEMDQIDRTPQRTASGPLHIIDPAADELSADDSPASTVAATPTDWHTKKTDMKAQKEASLFYPIEQLCVGEDNFIWADPSIAETKYSHTNTLQFQLVDEKGKTEIFAEYYSVGGGFIQKKGQRADDPKETLTPKYPYSSMAELRAQVASHPSLTLVELLVQNEMSLTGCDRQQIYDKMDQVIEAMEAAVERGINTTGLLPASFVFYRKAASVLAKAKRNATKTDSFLTFVNAYCLAVSEENAAGHMVVTAPTLGSSGVIPGLIYYLNHHQYVPRATIRDAMIVACAIGFLVKRNASISGAEMGCMGEVGIASAMAAALLTHAAGGNMRKCEVAAEIAIEHHLGVTCDPIGGFVLIPCIERNPMGAIKAYNAHILAMATEEEVPRISLDTIIEVMRQTGRDMSSAYKETGAAGLAKNFTEC